MRRPALIIILGALCAFPAQASADEVVGLAVLNQGPTVFDNIAINAGLSAAQPGAALGVTVGLASNGARNLGIVRCVRAEGRRASVVVRFLEPISADQGLFVGQVFWFEDRGLLGLDSLPDRNQNFRLTETRLNTEFSTCPSVTPPAPYKDIRLGDITVRDIL